MIRINIRVENHSIPLYNADIVEVKDNTEIVLATTYSPSSGYETPQGAVTRALELLEIKFEKVSNLCTMMFLNAKTR